MIQASADSSAGLLSLSYTNQAEHRMWLTDEEMAEVFFQL